MGSCWIAGSFIFRCGSHDNRFIAWAVYARGLHIPIHAEDECAWAGALPRAKINAGKPNHNLLVRYMDGRTQAVAGSEVTRQAQVSPFDFSGTDGFFRSCGCRAGFAICPNFVPRGSAKFKPFPGKGFRLVFGFLSF
jgi:hypothetical protein